MAATRLIPLHVNKGKTVAQCLADRTDYSENEKKTNNGEFISSYECDPKSCAQEFLLAKREYQHIGAFKVHFSKVLDLPTVRKWAKTRNRRIHSNRFDDLKVDVFIF